MEKHDFAFDVFTPTSLSLLPLACDELHGMCMKCTAYIIPISAAAKGERAESPNSR
ncbi:hypothetical protein RchiOBHm_Chr2g0172451 [Rosa chinensis]|uniref:Uncharacterized protein n=1 Tax=Rosa chinensis TaxID=74649 RepID=A0A2P6S5J8_ROSCH|nr:hypothetical protein RchiOBHm_Chr2g0172451 [Rosa chinensis]